MFGSIVVDLVIATALIFLVFSLVTSGLRELLAKLLETRSKELWRALRGALDDPFKSDFREVRARAVDLDAADGAGTVPSRVAAVEASELAVRAAVKEHMKPRDWRARVKEELGSLREVFPEGDQSAITRTERRLWLRQSKGSRGWLGIFKAGRRGGDRPLIPEVPSEETVADIAAHVRHRTKTLTDAVNEHPLVRQIDGTWNGYLSRLQRLESPDFTAATVDILRSAGVEPGLSSAFEGVLKQLDGLFPDESAADKFWPAIEGGVGSVMAKFEDTTVSEADVASAVVSIKDGIDDVIEELGGVSDEERQRLDEHLESARGVLKGYVDDPLQLVRIGVGYLEDTAPVKDALVRLSSGATRTVEEAHARLDHFGASLEEWYDRRMDLLSGWYRKRTRLVVFGLALLVAVGFNVDAVDAPQELWHNDQVRELVVASATQVESRIAGCVEQESLTADASECIETQIDLLVNTGLPLGWDVGTACDGECDSLLETVTYAVGTGGEGGRGTLAKLLGWILAAAALSVGASFWFDILRRATGFKRSVRTP